MNTLRHLARGFFVALAASLLAAPAAAANYLWEVTSLTSRAYIFGTVHAGKASWYPLPQAVEDAFVDSKVLVVEADITDANAISKSAASMMYTPPASLKTHIPAEQYARFARLLPRYGVPEEQVIRMKPFMAVSLLVFSEWARLGYMPNYGVDLYLLSKAKAEAKRIVEIEGVDEQIRLMDSLSEKELQQVFKGTLDALESGLTDAQVTGLMAAWQAGDPDGLLKVARQYNDRIAGAAEFEEKFIWARHDAMMKKIEGYLNGKDRHFIAVGALHLAGPRGLIELLKKRGYVVRQL